MSGARTAAGILGPRPPRSPRWRRGSRTGAGCRRWSAGRRGRGAGCHDRPGHGEPSRRSSDPTRSRAGRQQEQQRYRRPGSSAPRTARGRRAPRTCRSTIGVIAAAARMIVWREPPRPSRSSERSSSSGHAGGQQLGDAVGVVAPERPGHVGDDGVEGERRRRCPLGEPNAASVESNCFWAKASSGTSWMASTASE